MTPEQMRRVSLKLSVKRAEALADLLRTAIGERTYLVGTLSQDFWDLVEQLDGAS